MTAPASSQQLLLRERIEDALGRLTHRDHPLLLNTLLAAALKAAGGRARHAAPGERGR